MKKEKNRFWERLFVAVNVIQLVIAVVVGVAAAYLLGCVFGMGAIGYAIGFVLGVGIVFGAISW